MIEDCAGEVARGMTGAAILGRRQMPDRRLADRGDIIVATVAAAGADFGIGVIDRGAEKAQVVVARTAVQRGRNMVFGHGGADDAVVTIAASVLIQVGRPVVENPGRKGAGGVAATAILVRRQVSRIRFAERVDTVTAVASSRGHLGGAVVDEGVGEISGIVAGPAVLGGCDVSVRFGDGEPGVVAGRTLIDDTGVIEGRRQKARGLVTEMAILVRRHVPGRRHLARRDRAIVAGRTPIDNAGVIVFRAGKRRRVVAEHAVVGGRDRNMRCRHAGGIGAVVAVRTVVGNPLVIEHRGQKRTARRMAEHAVVAHRNMRRIDLRIGTDRVGAVVAGIAAIRSHRRPTMVDIGIDERRRVMAGCAILGAV